MIKNAFWTHDYISGVQAIIECLRYGYMENKQFMSIEDAHIESQHAISETFANTSNSQFAINLKNNNETISSESSLQFGLNVFTSDFDRQAHQHARKASRVKREIKEPIQQWFSEYKESIEQRSSKLFKLLEEYQRLVQQALKKKNIYYQSCRRSEDAKVGGSPKDSIIKTIRDLRDKLNASEENISSSANSIDTCTSNTPTLSNDPQAKRPESSRAKSSLSNTSEKIKINIAGLFYTESELGVLLGKILGDLSLYEYKVPFLKSYENVASGSMIATSARKHLQNDSFAYAEKFGQSLVNLDYLKPVGQMSNKYEHSHNAHYQIQEKYFDISKAYYNGTGEFSFYSSSSSAEDDSDVSNNLEAPHDSIEPPRTPIQFQSAPNSPSLSMNSIASSVIATDATEEHYIQAIVELDVFRCAMEVEIAKAYAFFDQILIDKYMVIKKGMQNLLFIVHPQDRRLIDAQKNLNAEKDLGIFVKQYETGPFVPNVLTFQSYYGQDVVQTFGVDLSLSNFFVSLVLDWLEKRPIEASNFDAWVDRSPIEEVYQLRGQINTGRPFNPDSVFRFFSVPVTISTFLQYLLELPESLIPFTVYETFKKLFDNSEHPEPSQIASILIQIPLINQEVLFRVLAFVKTLFDDKLYQQLSESLSIFIIRPRAPSALTMHDEHPQRLMSVLLENCHNIFACVADLNQNRESKMRSKPAVHAPTLYRPEGMLQSSISFNTSTDSSSSASSFSTNTVPNNNSNISTKNSISLGLMSPTMNNALRPLSLTMSPISESGDSNSISGLGLSSILPINKQSTPKANKRTVSSHDSPVRRRISLGLDLSKLNNPNNEPN